MAKWIILPLLILIIANSGCERIKNKTRNLTDKAKTKGKNLVDTLVNRAFPDHPPDTFSIRSVVKDFKADSSIKEIQGVQTDFFFLYVEYCKYIGKKDRVINGVNKIQAVEKNDYKSDKSCYLTNSTQFYKDIANEERTSFTQFFWDFEKL